MRFLGATHQYQGVLAVGFRGNRLKLLRFLALSLFDLMRFLAPPHQWFLKLTFLKTELWVYIVFFWAEEMDFGLSKISNVGIRTELEKRVLYAL
jgi:hypothetical protein